MALTTRCPQCHAVFRVVADQLKLRGGLVRCGQCATVFDAIGALSYLEDAQLKQALASRPASPSRPAAPAPAAPAPMPVDSSIAGSTTSAAARSATIAPPLLSAAPVVARAEPVEWAHLRRAAAASPLLLGGEHAAPDDADMAPKADVKPTPAPALDAPRPDVEVADRGTSDDESASAQHTASAAMDEAAREEESETSDPHQTLTAHTTDQVPGARAERGTWQAQAAFGTDLALGVQTTPPDRVAGDTAASVASVGDALLPDNAAEPSEAESEPSIEQGSSPADGGALGDELALRDTDADATGSEVTGRAVEAKEPEVAKEPETHGDDAAVRAEGMADEDADDIGLREGAAGAHGGDAGVPDAAADGRASGSASDEAVSDALATPAEAGFLNSVAQARARRRTWLWGLGVILAALVLAWQLAVALRAEILMRWPQAQPLLAHLCQPLGCQVEWPMQPALLAVLASDLQAVPGTAALELDVTLRNRAPYPQALPAIELTLMDTRGQAIVRRVFSPAEYGAPAQGSLAPGADLAARVLFEVKGPAPAGFLVYPFYP